MAERLELALSWDLMASELKVGMAETQKNTAPVGRPQDLVDIGLLESLDDGSK